jgi:DNA-binding transcriptional MerR regulator
VSAPGTGQPPRAQPAAASPEPGAGYRLGEVARQTGLSPKQLRQWEQRGLVTPVHGIGGQRAYTMSDLERLRRAKTMRDSGMTLREIKQVLWIISATSLGNEVEGLAEIGRICRRVGAQLALAEDLAEVLRARLARRNGGSTRAHD